MDLKKTVGEEGLPADFLKLLSPCRLCPRECGVDRARDERGFCGTGVKAKVAAVSLHHGEEPPISGTGGAGNIFFSGCNLACLFCQNYPISRMGVGREMGTGELAGAMLSLEKKGAHNINLVSPAHVVPQVASAIYAARRAGLTVPVVYNTNGYEKPETLARLEGLVDIYLPDMKYGSDTAARRLSGVLDYPYWNRLALAEMFRQAGYLKTGDGGVAERGLIVRHLVLPGNSAATDKVISYLADSFGEELHLSLMFQYFPAFKMVGDPTLGRRLRADECEEVLSWIEESPICRGWRQEVPEGIRQNSIASGPSSHSHNESCASGHCGNIFRPSFYRPS